MGFGVKRCGTIISFVRKTENSASLRDENKLGNFAIKCLTEVNSALVQ
jgi:hypothetical protein